MILESAAGMLGLTPDYIRRVATRSSHMYKEYLVPKRSGGMRIIHHPAKPLKAIQRWLVRFPLKNWPIHDAAWAYRENRSIKQHAELHAKSNYLLRLDIESFFPSLKERDFDMFVSEHSNLTDGWSATDIDLVRSILFRFGELTIGAPTSPLISNVLCHGLDIQLRELAHLNNVIYTRYADDMFFSCIPKDILHGVEKAAAAIIEGSELPGGLRIKKEKTRHLSRRRRRTVTGIVLGPDKTIYLGRQRKREIRSMVHQYHTLDLDAKAKLSGLLAFARDIDPDFLNSLVSKYGFEKVASAQKAE